MALIIPGLHGMHDEAEEKCSLCTGRIIYLATFAIRAYDASTGMEVRSSMEFPVCDGHADKVSFEITKDLRAWTSGASSNIILL